MGLAWSDYRYPEVSPNYEEAATFDPLIGFPNGREERKMQVTEEQMNKVRLKPSERDYCAHLIIDFYQCRYDKFPLVYQCKSVLNKWHHCEFEDYILRMKEYERERRLMVRAQRKKKREEVSDVMTH